MKAFMILGALIGFCIGGGFSLAGDCGWSTALWRACAAALPAAILARWWSRMWLVSLGDAVEKSRQARANATFESKPISKL
jgi:hypothetical protein